jgi:hypothetical protein
MNDDISEILDRMRPEILRHDHENPRPVEIHVRRVTMRRTLPEVKHPEWMLAEEDRIRAKMLRQAEINIQKIFRGEPLG